MPCLFDQPDQLGASILHTSQRRLRDIFLKSSFLVGTIPFLLSDLAEITDFEVSLRLSLLILSGNILAFVIEFLTFGKGQSLSSQGFL